MDDGDGYFDLDNLEYASDFGAPTDHSSGVPFAIGGYGYLIAELIGLLSPPA